MTIKLFINKDTSHFRLSGAPARSIDFYNQLKAIEKPTVVASCGIIGRGLFADVSVKKNQYIIEYVGELVDDAEYNRRYDMYKDRGYKHDYFQHIKDGMHLDATMIGNKGRYANHSCNPNSTPVRVRLEGTRIYVLFLAANRRINKGEPITFDYGWFKSDTGIIDMDECKCGSSNCRGYI